MKVSLIGVAGGIGQALGLLLKQSLPAGSILSVYDISPITDGVGIDLSHIPTPVKIEYYSGQENFGKAIQNSDIILNMACRAPKAFKTRNELLEPNSGLIKSIANVIAKHAPKAFVCLMTNPLNIMVPITAYELEKHGVYDPKRLFGITELDVLRAENFIAEVKNLSPDSIKVKVIGGHSQETTLTLLSQLDYSFTKDETEFLDHKIKTAALEVVKGKNNNGSATLAMAYAAARFTLKLVTAKQGKPTEITAYVQHEKQPCDFFAGPLIVNENGVRDYLQLGFMNQEETKQYEDLVKVLQDEIQVAKDFIKNNS